MLVAVGSKVHVWDRGHGHLLATFPDRHIAATIAIAPDGKTALVGHDKDARLWDVATATPIGPPARSFIPLTAAAFSPDGRIAAIGCLGKFQLWETATGQPVGPPCLCPGWVRAVAFTPDGQTLFIGTDKTIYTSKIQALGICSHERLQLSVEVLTGLEMGPGGEIRPLDGTMWRTRSSQLARLGGSVFP